MNPEYEEWLKETGLDDTEENKGWFNCPEEDRADYIRNNSEWWNNF